MVHWGMAWQGRGSLRAACAEDKIKKMVVAAPGTKCFGGEAVPLKALGRGDGAATILFAEAGDVLSRRGLAVGTGAPTVLLGNQGSIG